MTQHAETYDVIPCVREGAHIDSFQQYTQVLPLFLHRYPPPSLSCLFLPFVLFYLLHFLPLSLTLYYSCTYKALSIQINFGVRCVLHSHSYCTALRLFIPIPTHTLSLSIASQPTHMVSPIQCCLVKVFSNHSFKAKAFQI